MLDSKQRAFLRGKANDIPAIFQIGKGGINDNLKKQIFDALEARELIKIHVLNNSDYSAREACDELCSMVGANPVSVVGSKFIIYKRSREHKKIILPGEPRPKPKTPVKPNSKKKLTEKIQKKRTYTRKVK